MSYRKARIQDMKQAYVLHAVHRLISQKSKKQYIPTTQQ